ncbi:MAG: cation-transporting P-type ATPase, partial [Defluviitaleaceae bacterium]|nr:cation-transporting P-type ATPase [Defluviitaleaceae bacterium]
MPKPTPNSLLTHGLTDAEALRSRERHGSNEIARKSRNSFFKQYLASFGDPIIKILLIALFVNVLIMFRDMNWYETAGIALAVLLATLVSTVSEYGSESAFEKLQEEAARIKCRVKRAGEVRELPVGEV